jgi:hypothetical protein
MTGLHHPATDVLEQEPLAVLGFQRWGLGTTALSSGRRLRPIPRGRSPVSKGLEWPSVLSGAGGCRPRRSVGTQLLMGGKPEPNGGSKFRDQRVTV